MFESSVNLQGNETKPEYCRTMDEFESSVNLQGNETFHNQDILVSEFESSVNLQGNETHLEKSSQVLGLRVV